MPGKIKRFGMIVSTRCTGFVKPKFSTDIYQCSLFHLHEIHLCTCSYRIPGCCHRQHHHYSCVLLWHTRRYLKQQKGSNWKTLNWNGAITKLFALTQYVSLSILLPQAQVIYSPFDNVPMQIFYRSYLNRQHFRLWFFASVVRKGSSGTRTQGHSDITIP